MADKQVKLAVKHSKNCRAVKLVEKGDWDTPWGPIAYGTHGPSTIKTWRRYGKNGRVLKTWVRFICNCTDCKAELHVDAEFILKQAMTCSVEASKGRV